MKEKKNIDRIFQEGFKDFEVTPDTHVWNNIQAKLENKNTRKPFVIPLWYKVAGVAALFALLFWLGQSIWNINDATDGLVDTEEQLDVDNQQDKFENEASEINNEGDVLTERTNPISKKNNTIVNSEGARDEFNE